MTSQPIATVTTITARAPDAQDPLLGPNREEQQQQQPQQEDSSQGVSASSNTVSTDNNNETASATIPTHLVVSNLLAYVLNVWITYGVGVFGDKSNAELSRKYQTLITPIGGAFAIWGIIFLAQLIWIVYPLILIVTRRMMTNTTTAATTGTAKIWIQAVGYLYVWIVVIQIMWTISFSQEIIWLSACAMVTLCGLLWCTVSSLLQTKSLFTEQQQDESTTTTTTTLSFSTSSYFLWIFPFTIHAGWVTAATAVNINVLLVAENSPSSVQFGAALVSLGILFVLALWIVRNKIRIISGGDRTMALAIAWALLGVFFELNTSTDEVILQRFTLSQIEVARFGALIATILIVVFALMNRTS